MKVLHVSQPVDGGVAAYVLAASVDQLARGWDVTVACPTGGTLTADLAGAGVAHLTWQASRSPGSAVLGETRRLGALIARQQPDVVHLHASKAGLAGRLAVRLTRPTIFQPHGWSWLAVDGPMLPTTVAWERMAARWASRLVCVGAEEAAQGRRRGVRGRYAVVRNGVDLSRFRPANDGDRAEARARLGVDGGAALAVCVGRLTRQKGQDVLMSAWPLVRERCPVAELALVGDGDLEPALRAVATPGVRFAGAVSDVRDWLVAADVLVLPSRWEGLPLVALEALATGRPVVATAIPGLAEVVSAEVGALVPPVAAGPLADAIATRLRDRALARAEGAAAARLAAGFDQRLTFDRLAAVTAGVAASAHEIGRYRDGRRPRTIVGG
jgi:glycosyltransferase involved in cell wall biosynthesis